MRENEQKNSEMPHRGGRGVNTTDAIMQKIANGEEMKEGLQKVKLRLQNGCKN